MPFPYLFPGFGGFPETGPQADSQKADASTEELRSPQKEGEEETRPSFGEILFQPNTLEWAKQANWALATSGQWQAAWDKASAEIGKPQSQWEQPSESLEEAIFRNLYAPKGAARWLAERSPFAGGGIKAYDLYELWRASQRLADDKPEPGDYDIVGEYLADQIKAKEASTLEWGLDIASRIPGYAIEFGLTGGAYTAGRKATEKVLTKGLEKLLEGLAKKAAAKTIAKAAGKVAIGVGSRVVGVAAQALANPQQIAENLAQNLVDQYQLSEDDAGKLKMALKPKPDSTLSNLYSAAVSTMVELGSERAGGPMARAFGAIGRGLARYTPKTIRDAAHVLATKIPEAAKPSVIKAAMLSRLLRSGRSLDSIMEVVKRAKWDSLFYEMLEQRLAEVGEFLTRTGDAGLIGNLIQGKIHEAVRQLGAELLGFGFIEALVQGATLPGRIRYLKAIDTLKTNAAQGKVPPELAEATIEALAQDNPEVVQRIVSSMASRVPYKPDTEEYNTIVETLDRLVRKANPNLATEDIADITKQLRGLKGDARARFLGSIQDALEVMARRARESLGRQAEEAPVPPPEEAQPVPPQPEGVPPEGAQPQVAPPEAAVAPPERAEEPTTLPGAEQGGPAPPVPPVLPTVPEPEGRRYAEQERETGQVYEDGGARRGPEMGEGPRGEITPEEGGGGVREGGPGIEEGRLSPEEEEELNAVIPVVRPLVGDEKALLRIARQSGDAVGATVRSLNEKYGDYGPAFLPRLVSGPAAAHRISNLVRGFAKTPEEREVAERFAEALRPLVGDAQKPSPLLAHLSQNLAEKTEKTTGLPWHQQLDWYIGTEVLLQSYAPLAIAATQVEKAITPLLTPNRSWDAESRKRVFAEFSALANSLRELHAASQSIKDAGNTVATGKRQALKPLVDFAESRMDITVPGKSRAALYSIEEGPTVQDYLTRLRQRVESVAKTVTSQARKIGAMPAEAEGEREKQVQEEEKKAEEKKAEPKEEPRAEVRQPKQPPAPQPPTPEAKAGGRMGEEEAEAFGQQLADEILKLARQRGLLRAKEQRTPEKVEGEARAQEPPTPPPTEKVPEGKTAEPAPPPPVGERAEAVTEKPPVEEARPGEGPQPPAPRAEEPRQERKRIGTKAPSEEEAKKPERAVTGEKESRTIATGQVSPIVPVEYRDELQTLAATFGAIVYDNRRIGDSQAARAIAAEALGRERIDPHDALVKVIEEAIEIGAIQGTRLRLPHHGTVKTQWQEILRIVDGLPRLSRRTAGSYYNKAYSTPLTLAYIANVVTGVSKGKSILEPTAGNGALLIGSNGPVTAIELDPNRAEALRDMGFQTVIQGSAQDMAVWEKVPGPFDIVLANPPFASAKEHGNLIKLEWHLAEPDPDTGTMRVSEQTYASTRVEHHIVALALNRLARDGKAAFIVAAPGMKFGEQDPQQQDRNRQYLYEKNQFWSYVYDNFNVIDHVTISGEVYRQQGAGFPIDFVVIDGRRKSQRLHPARDLPPILSTLGELYERFLAVRWSEDGLAPEYLRGPGWTRLERNLGRAAGAAGAKAGPGRLPPTAGQENILAGEAERPNVPERVPRPPGRGGTVPEVGTAGRGGPMGGAELGQPTGVLGGGPGPGERATEATGEGAVQQEGREGHPGGAERARDYGGVPGEGLAPQAQTPAEATEQAEQRFRAAVERLRNILKEQGGALNLGVNAEIAGQIFRVTAAAIERGYRRFSDFVRRLATDVGTRAVRRLHSVIERAWDRIARQWKNIRPRGKTTAEEILAKLPDETATREAVKAQALESIGGMLQRATELRRWAMLEVPARTLIDNLVTVGSQIKDESVSPREMLRLVAELQGQMEDLEEKAQGIPEIVAETPEKTAAGLESRIRQGRAMLEKAEELGLGETLDAIVPEVIDLRTAANNAEALLSKPPTLEELREAANALYLYTNQVEQTLQERAEGLQQGKRVVEKLKTVGPLVPTTVREALGVSAGEINALAEDLGNLITNLEQPKEASRTLSDLVKDTQGVIDKAEQLLDKIEQRVRPLAPHILKGLPSVVPEVRNRTNALLGEMLVVANHLKAQGFTLPAALERFIERLSAIAAETAEGVPEQTPQWYADRYYELAKVGRDLANNSRYQRAKARAFAELGRQKKLAALNAKLKAAVKELRKAMRSVAKGEVLFANLPLDPVLMQALADVVLTAIETGAATFEQMVHKVRQVLGQGAEKQLEDIAAGLERTWDILYDKFADAGVSLRPRDGRRVAELLEVPVELGPTLVAKEAPEQAEEQQDEQKKSLDEINTTYEPATVDIRDPETRKTAPRFLVPLYLHSAIRTSLERVKNEVGDLRRYVQEATGLSDKAMRTLVPEQIDAIALSIYNHEKHYRATIIGDQTGVGKGAQLASMMTYALKHGLLPIFVTRDANLYADMVRDLSMIDMNTESQPFQFIATNDMSGKGLPLPDGRTYRMAGREAVELLEDLAEAFINKTVKHLGLEGFEFQDRTGKTQRIQAVFTSYHQMRAVAKKMKRRHTVLMQLAPYGFMLLDESHEATGGEFVPPYMRESLADVPDVRAPQNMADAIAFLRYGFHTGDMMRGLLSLAGGAVYASATFAKDPRQVSLYMRTSLRDVPGGIDRLSEIMSLGGTPLYQVLISGLAQVGQYIRRELDMTGIEFNVNSVSVNLGIVNDLAAFMEEVLNLKHIVREVIRALKDENKRLERAGVQQHLSYSSVTFGSMIWNLANQALLSILADQAADAAIAAVREGRAPVITMMNTLESPLREILGMQKRVTEEEEGAAEEGEGKEVEDLLAQEFPEGKELTFRDLLTRLLDRALRINITSYEGNKKKVSAIRITPELVEEVLGFSSQQIFESALDRAREVIDKVDVSAPVSPLDWIQMRLENAGISVGELTGRSLGIRYEASGPKTLGTVYHRKAPGPGEKVQIIRNFNSGQVSAILMNSAAATGISLHALGKDAKQREMIIVQAPGDITQFVQTLGRVNRLGQSKLPRYTLIFSDLPLQRRLTAMLMRKLRSLNATIRAQTTSNIAFDLPDFMNPVGDTAMKAMLEHNKRLAYRLLEGSRYQINNEGQIEESKDLAKYASGRTILLNLDEQERFWDTYLTQYEALVNEAEMSGTSPLGAKVYNGTFTITKSYKMRTAEEGEATNIFTQPAILNETVLSVKPPPPTRVLQILADFYHAKPEEVRDEDTLRRLQDAWMHETTQRLTQEAEEYRQQHRNLYDKPELEQHHAESVQLLLNRLREFLPGTIVTIVSGHEDEAGGAVTEGIVVKLNYKRTSPNPALFSPWNVVVAKIRGEGAPIAQFGLLSRHLIAREIDPTSYSINTINDVVKALQEGSYQEERYIVTGNLLAWGYEAEEARRRRLMVAYVNTGRGIQPAIILPRDYGFDPQRWEEKKSALLSADEAARFFELGGDVLRTADGTLTISQLPDGELIVAIPRRLMRTTAAQNYVTAIHPHLASDAPMMLHESVNQYRAPIPKENVTAILRKILEIAYTLETVTAEGHRTAARLSSEAIQRQMAEEEEQAGEGQPETPAFIRPGKRTGKRLGGKRPIAEAVEAMLGPEFSVGELPNGNLVVTSTQSLLENEKLAKVLKNLPEYTAVPDVSDTRNVVLVPVPRLWLAKHGSRFGKVTFPQMGVIEFELPSQEAVQDVHRFLMNHYPYRRYERLGDWKFRVWTMPEEEPNIPVADFGEPGRDLVRIGREGESTEPGEAKDFLSPAGRMVWNAILRSPQLLGRTFFAESLRTIANLQSQPARFEEGLKELADKGVVTVVGEGPAQRIFLSSPRNPIHERLEMQTAQAPSDWVPGPYNYLSREFVLTLERLFHVPIRTGRLRTKRARGEYWHLAMKRTKGRPRETIHQLGVGPQVVRVKETEYARMWTVAHEVGHHLDNMYGFSSVMFRLKDRSILEQLRDMDYDAEARRAHEGFAELVAAYLLDSPKLPAKLREWLENEFQAVGIFEKIQQAKEVALRYKLPLEERVKRAVSNVPPKAKLPLANLFDTMTDAAVTWYTDLKDQFYPLKLLYEEAAAKDPSLARRARASAYEMATVYYLTAPSHAEAAYKHGIHTITDVRREISQPLMDIFKYIHDADDYVEAMAYIVARHVELYTKALKARFIAQYERKPKPDELWQGPISYEDAVEWRKQVQRERPDDAERYEQVGQIIAQFNNAALIMATDAGVFTFEELDAMLKMYSTTDEHGRPVLFYLPAWRVPDDAPSGYRRVAGMRMVDLPKAIRRRTRGGSSRQIIDPVWASLRRTIYLYDRAMRQMIFDALIREAQVPGMGHWLVKVPGKPRVLRLPLSRILDDLKSLGILDDAFLDKLRLVERFSRGTLTPEELKRLVQYYDLDVDLPGLNMALEDSIEADPSLHAVLAIWSTDHSPDPGRHIVRHVVDGKAENYELHPLLYDAVRGMDPIRFGPFMQILSEFAKLFKLGAIGWSTRFGLRNIFMDYQTNLIQARQQKGFQRVTSPWTWLARYLMYVVGRRFGYKDRMIEMFEEHGGKLFTRLGYDKASFDMLLSWELEKSVAGKLKAAVLHPITTVRLAANAVRDLITWSDLGPRLAEFEAVLHKYGYEVKKGKIIERATGTVAHHVPEAVLVKALYAAAETTFNYKRIGRKLKVADAIFPLLNASIEPTDKMLRTAAALRHIAKSGDRGAYARQIALWLAVTGSAGALYWFLRGGDDDYRELPIDIKRRHWTFGWDGVTYIAIPRSREYGMLAGMVEALLEAHYGNDRDSAVRELLIQELLDRIPTGGGLLRGMVEAFMNYDLYLGREIEPPYMRELPKPLRYDEWTLETSKALGRLLGLSPKMLEHVLRQVSGGAYTRWVGAVERTVKSGKVEFRDLPFIPGIAREWTAGKSLDEFYSELSKANEAYQFEKADGKVTVETAQRLGYLRNVYSLLRLLNAKWLAKDKENRRELYRRFATGIARTALDYEPMTAYPDPLLMKPEELPGEVRNIVQDYINQLVEVVGLGQGMPVKAETKDEKDYNERMREWEANYRADRQFITKYRGSQFVIQAARRLLASKKYVDLISGKTQPDLRIKRPTLEDFQEAVNEWKNWMRKTESAREFGRIYSRTGRENPTADPLFGRNGQR